MHPYDNETNFSIILRNNENFSIQQVRKFSATSRGGFGGSKTFVFHGTDTVKITFINHNGNKFLLSLSLSLAQAHSCMSVNLRLILTASEHVRNRNWKTFSILFFFVPFRHSTKELNNFQLSVQTWSMYDIARYMLRELLYEIHLFIIIMMLLFIFMLFWMPRYIITFRNVINILVLFCSTEGVWKKLLCGK